MARDSGEEERHSCDEGKVEEWEEDLLGGNRRGGVEGVKSGEFNRVGCANGREMWVGLVAYDSEAVAEGVGGFSGGKGFGGWVGGMKCEGGEVGGTEGLRFGKVGVGGGVQS